MRVAVAVADEVALARALLVVGRGLAVQPLRGGVGRLLAVGRFEVDPRRHPDDGPHLVVAHRPHHPRRVGELVGVEAPRVVLRLPGRVDHDRVQRQLVVAVAAPVVADVVLVLVDVAALPVAVGPLRQHGRKAPGGRGECPKARGGGVVAEEVEAERAGRGSCRDRDVTAAEVELGSGSVGLEPGGPAARGEQPGHRCIVALRDPAGFEHLGRAVRARVAPVGAERHAATALVENEAVASPEPGEPLAGRQRPRGAHPHRRIRCLHLHEEAVGALIGDRDLVAPGPPAALFVHDHALGQRDQLVVGGALAAPRLQVAEHGLDRRVLPVTSIAGSVTRRTFTTSLRRVIRSVTAICAANPKIPETRESMKRGSHDDEPAL